jgi:ATP-dependent DNA helicase RecG
MFKKLGEKYFPQNRLILLYSRVDEEEKAIAMEKFFCRQADILVSTTIIEVGVDVPGASFIIIENAHRFGLSTLHQLRGRVGRSDIPATCFLVTPNELTPDGKQRMMAMRDSDDGFVLAQKDMEIRGVGEFLGTNQRGVSELKIASLLKIRKSWSKPGKTLLPW